MRALALLSLCVPLLGGCQSIIDKQAAKSTYRILEASQRAARSQSDIALAREAMPGGILQLAAFALAYPDMRGFRALHAEALCQYAVAFVFDDFEDAQLAKRDTTAVADRLRGLLASCSAANRALLPRDVELANATPAQVPQVRWIATAQAMVIALDPFANAMKLPETLALLRRCVALAPGAHEADAELLLGTLEAATSRLLGGPDGAAQLEAARRALGEGALIVDVMFARAVAVARRDRALFESTLRRVLAADVTRWPERRLDNELARGKARRYLAAIDTLLPP